MKMGLGFVLSLSTLGVLAAACGGKVIYVAGGESGGAGGSSTHATTTHGTSVVSTGQTGTSVVSSNVSTNDVTVGDVMPLCDTGTPGDFGSPACDDCVNCSLNSICASQFQQFQNDPDGQAFNDCVSQCQMGGPPNCFQMCQMQHPQGASEYFQIIDCIACNACPINCNAQQNCMVDNGAGGASPSGGSGG